MYNANCSDLNLYWYDLRFEADCDSYLCHIVAPLELSEHCTVDSTRCATVCDSDLPVCTYGQSQTDSQHIAQITTTPVLPSTTLSARSNSTGLAGAASEPAPTVPSGIASPSIAPADTASEPTPSVSSSTNATDCIRLERVSCHIAVGVGALAVIVVLLVVVVIVVACISVKRGKMKMQSE